jgi:hypothetical protein
MKQLPLALLSLLLLGAIFVQVPQAMAASPLIDFNGDGYADLAVGVPTEDVNGQANAGLVNVIYGSAAGLSATTVPDQRFFQDYSAGTPGSNIRDTSEANDLFGAALAAADFNGDGYSDLAAGVPEEDLGGVADAGAVNVIYGSSAGLSPDAVIANQVWSQGSADVEDSIEQGDHFGSSLAAADFDDDGYFDLAIGVPNESINGHPSAGSVNILYGSAGGLSPASDQRFFQDTAGIADFSEDNDHYGSSLAGGDLDGDGHGDLVVGARGEDIGPVADAGALSVIYGSPSGLSASNVLPDQLWTGTSPGLDDTLPPACPTPISGIGHPGALATGDFNGDGYDDAGFGAATHFPGEGSGGPCGHAFYGARGILFVIYGSPSGLAITASRPDQVGREDSIADFARTVSAGDFNNDGNDDLVTSFAAFFSVAPGDLTGGGLGNVYVYHGSPAGLPESTFPSSAGLLEPSQGWSQGEADDDVEDRAETQDHFGYAVATDDFNGDAYADIAVGVPGEDLSPHANPYEDLHENQGAVNTIYGSASGLSATAVLQDQFWMQDTSSIEDAAESGDQFGGVLG